MKDLFGDAPVCAKEDAFGFLIRWARRHRRAPFNPEEGYIRRAGLFPRASSNHSVRPGWVGV